MAKLVKPMNPAWRKSLVPALTDRASRFERVDLKKYAARVKNAAAQWNAERAEYDAKASGVMAAVRLSARKLARAERVCDRVDAALDIAMENGAPDMDALSDLSARAWDRLAEIQLMHASIQQRVPKGDPGTFADFSKAQRDALKGALGTFRDLVAVRDMVRANGAASVTEADARAWAERYGLKDITI